MTAIFIAVVLVAFLFILAASRERHRERLLRLWVERHSEATLHWGFDPDSVPEFPARKLVEELLGRPPLGFAAAVGIERQDGPLWLAEYRTTPPGKKTDRWFVLVAQRFPDEAAAEVAMTGDDPMFVVGGCWVCRKLQGLITPGMLESLHAPVAP